MKLDDDRRPQSRADRLLIDSNLLVLYIVGKTNPNRIETFKRTRQFTKAEFRLLLDFVTRFRTLYTIAHVMAEVSNLTDLSGKEIQASRRVLRQTVTVLQEPVMPSARATEERCFEHLGLVDAAIAAAAREYQCTVLTTDVVLYRNLHADGIDAVNFTHLRARAMGL